MTEIIIKEDDQFFVKDQQFGAVFTLNSNEVLQVVGENGIGKSSLLQFLMLNKERLFPNSKTYFVDQLRLNPLNLINFEDLKCILYGDRVEELEIFKEFEKFVKPFTNTAIRNLSGGQNQLIKLSTMLYVSADIFFLDEPFQYLDHSKQQLVLKMIKSLKEMGKTVVIIEHQVKLEGLVDRTLEVYSDGEKIKMREV